MTTPDIAGLCERLRDALEGVTPGPWVELETESSVSLDHDEGDRLCGYTDIGPEDGKPVAIALGYGRWADAELDANAAFIVLSREAVPSLLDTIERQAAEIETLRALLMLARPFVADDTEATCDLADRIDAALTGEDA